MGVLMFKKIFIGFMLSFIVIIQIGCCNLYTKNKNKLDTNTFYLNQKLKNYKNSPLHDGAIVIENEVITATRVILPIENTIDIPSHFGLRHRAGLGITIRTDALSLIVSEESGQVSYVNNGAFILFEDFSELAEIIKDDLNY